MPMPALNRVAAGPRLRSGFCGLAVSMSVAQPEGTIHLWVRRQAGTSARGVDGRVEDVGTARRSRL